MNGSYSLGCTSVNEFSVYMSHNNNRILNSYLQIISIKKIESA